MPRGWTRSGRKAWLYMAERVPVHCALYEDENEEEKKKTTRCMVTMNELLLLFVCSTAQAQSQFASVATHPRCTHVVSGLDAVRRPVGSSSLGLFFHSSSSRVSLARSFQQYAMVVLHGSHVKWDRHPDFLGRYDFAVTSPPSAVWLISRVETFKSSTVEYQKTVHTFGESGTRIYYTAFTWTDSNGNRQRVSDDTGPP